jgi:hypothetical protein
MTELMHTEVNCETGEVTTRPLTIEELATYEQMQVEAARQMEEQTLARETEIATLASAHTKLTALGLSDEEIQALAGKALPSSAS